VNRPRYQQSILRQTTISCVAVPASLLVGFSDIPLRASNPLGRSSTAPPRLRYARPVHAR